MNKVLKSLNLIYGTILLILPLIKEIEIPGWGQDKKKAILNIVATFYDKLVEQNTLPMTKKRMLGIAGNFIDIVVAFFNIVGWIKYDSPYRQFLGDSWLEREVTIPLWTKIFKSLGIYNANYHKKYRKYLYGKRYKTYINLVTEDIQENIRSMNRAQIEECMKVFSRKKEFVCPDLPK